MWEDGEKAQMTGNDYTLFATIAVTITIYYYRIIILYYNSVVFNIVTNKIHSIITHKKMSTLFFPCDLSS